MSLRLYQVKNSNLQLREYMKDHYSKPQGFVGRNLCYLVYFGETCYGAIVAGSATLHLAGRDEFFGLSGNKTQKQREIRTIINNTFFHLEKVNGKYPIRWQFTTKVLAAFRCLAAKDWLTKYGDVVIGFESLVELPRTGKIYEQDGWTEVGQTIGYTCKRTAGKGTDSWSGRRIWDTKNLRPKRVFCKLTSLPIIQQAIHDHVEVGSQLFTDEHKAYSGLDGLFFHHQAINHSGGEYGRGLVTTNSIESVWALLKRGITGVYHHTSKKHLNRYVNEFTFRLNFGNVKFHTLERLDSFVLASFNKRLTYKELTA